MTEEIWTQENSQQLVQKYVRTCNVLFGSQDKVQDALELAHRAAEVEGCKTPDEHAVLFSKALRDILVTQFGQDAVDSVKGADTVVAPLPLSPKPLNTPIATPTRKSVEEWEAEGIKFRPAVARLPPMGVEEPQDHTPKRRPLESAMDLQDKSVATADSAPWGKSATRMAAWAWEILHPGKTIPVNQATLIGNVLSVLHHAGILREGAIIPVGYGHKADVRGTRKEK